MKTTAMTAVFLLSLSLHCLSNTTDYGDAGRTLTPTFDNKMNHDVITLKVGTYAEHLNAIQNILITRDCPELTSIDIQPSEVEIIEPLILCLALRAGGIEPRWQIQAYPLAARMLIEIEQGNILTSAYPFWSRHIKEDVNWASQALVGPKEYTKGFYTQQHNTKALSTKTLENLSQLIGVSNNTWEADWEVIDCMKLTAKSSALSYEGMYRNVASGQGDYLLIDFPAAPDLQRRDFGIALSPIPSFKIVFNDSLHYLISQQYPDADKIFTALNKGLKKLEQDGTILYGYQQLGQFNPTVEDWTALHCDH